MWYKIRFLELHPILHCNFNCGYCENMSPFSEMQVYSFEDFSPWLDKMLESNFNFDCFLVGGGEPFLHPDIGEFIVKLKEKYNRFTILRTNGVLLSGRNIAQYAKLFANLDLMRILVRKEGLSSKEMVNLKTSLEFLKNEHGCLKVEFGNVKAETRFEFTREKIGVEKLCGRAFSHNLLPDGRLARCRIGAYAHLHPQVTPEFTESSDVFFDLKKFDKDFNLWNNRWPMDACSYCTFHLNRPIEEGCGCSHH